MDFNKNIYQNDLNTEAFAQMLSDPTQCYKFYWLEALINLMQKEKNEIVFDDIVNQMIIDAWYTVNEYHLHLGPCIQGKCENYLEHAIHSLSQLNVLQSSADAEEILLLIKNNESLIKEDKLNLIKYVPYRLLSSFLDLGGNEELWNSKTRLIAYILKFNEKDELFYTIKDGKGLGKKAMINEDWKQFVFDNYEMIKGWIEEKKIRYLQNRNPSVPGIIYKLHPQNQNARKLENVRTLWLLDQKITQQPITDLYTDKQLDPKRFSLDHFIPWSYISNDEIWDLVPTDRNLNSSKGNKLPLWNRYFPSLVDMHYVLYQTIFSNEQMYQAFDRCRKDNVNAIWANEKLYIPSLNKEQFSNVMTTYMKPIYENAHLQGFQYWK